MELRQKVVKYTNANRIYHPAAELIPNYIPKSPCIASPAARHNLHGLLVMLAGKSLTNFLIIISNLHIYVKFGLTWWPGTHAVP
jgi:hypothetical protein